MAEHSKGLLHVSHDDAVVGFGEETEINASSQRNFKHPGVVFFTVAFRASSLFLFLFCGWLGFSFISSFVVITLLLCADFWTMKNISGRLLAGLRWWNQVDDDGNSHWVFEARKNQPSNADSRIFWLALILSPVLWVIFFLTSIIGLSLNWLMLVCLALALNGANLFGYLRCRVGKSDGLTTMASNYFKESLLKNVIKTVTRQSNPPPTAPSRQV